MKKKALILKLLREKDVVVKEEKETDKPCKNEHCILTTEQELEKRCYIDGKGVRRCLYCDSEL